MPIPHDPLCRWWVEASAENPAQVEALRPSLLAFTAFGPGREPGFAGSGFVIARMQRPSAAHAPSALFIPANLNKPSLDPEKLKVTWMGARHANMMNVLHVGYNETLDIACCVIAPQELHAAPFQPVSIPVDTAVPNVEEMVHMASLDNMTIDELVPPTDASGIGQTISLTRRVSIRIGVVTGIYPGGLRQYRWPCFTTSIPAEP